MRRYPPGGERLSLPEGRRLLEQALGDEREHVADEALVREMEEEGAAGHVRRLADLLDRDRVEALGLEERKRGLEYLRKITITPNSKTYVVGLQTMALCLAKQPTLDKARIEANVDGLDGVVVVSRAALALEVETPLPALERWRATG